MDSSDNNRGVGPCILRWWVTGKLRYSSTCIVALFLARRQGRAPGVVGETPTRALTAKVLPRHTRGHRMKRKLFSDVSDALGKVGSGLTALANLPKTGREKYCQTLAETLAN